MTQQSPLAAPDRIHRECDCPPYVLRCAHHETALLWLTDNDMDCGACDADFSAPDNRYSVVEPSYEILCEVCDDRVAKRFYSTTNNYDEALVAFHEAELALLRGAE